MAAAAGGEETERKAGAVAWGRQVEGGGVRETKGRGR